MSDAFSPHDLQTPITCDTHCSVISKPHDGPCHFSFTVEATQAELVAFTDEWLSAHNNAEANRISQHAQATGESGKLQQMMNDFATAQLAAIEHQPLTVEQRIAHATLDERDRCTTIAESAMAEVRNAPHALACKNGWHGNTRTTCTCFKAKLLESLAKIRSGEC